MIRRLKAFLLRFDGSFPERVMVLLALWVPIAIWRKYHLIQEWDLFSGLVAIVASAFISAIVTAAAWTFVEKILAGVGIGRVPTKKSQ